MTPHAEKYSALCSDKTGWSCALQRLGAVQLRTSIFALATLLSLAACDSPGSGGGGGTPTPTPTPTPNSAPIFTSATTASILENNTGTYAAVATDPNGDPITYTISGGNDAARFSITPGGGVNFVAAPNYDLPGDSNRDNIYEVQVRASDGTLASTLDVRIAVANSTEGIVVVNNNWAFFHRKPLLLVSHPAANNAFFIGGKDGTVWQHRTNSDEGGGSFLPAGGSGDGEEEMGQLGFVPLFNYATSGFALQHRTLPDHSSEIVEVNRDGRAPRRLMLIPRQLQSPINYAGWMAFGPDGYLYVGTGDGGGTGDPFDNAQNPNSLLGKILRIQVDRSSGTTVFAPAPGNPFIGGGGNPYVFAMGLRNPRRASFDGNRLIIAEVSESVADEINVMPIDQPGMNFGWPFLQGTTPYKGVAPTGLTAPVLLYPHTAGRRANSILGSILGGVVYRGPIASLNGHYVFADYLLGNVYSIPASQLVLGQTLPFTSVENRTLDFAIPQQSTEAPYFLEEISSFGLTLSGDLYLLDFKARAGDGPFGEIHRVAAAP
ncbi:PQQ-dependent sugar dehydrogenase [Sphingomonas sp. BT-65]|uniref:PQQ-dependent sugar dehydrogenase n=1 Tax=Sphingomonas sp. BT-65 TaxID=2989821 RepID=UPI002235F27B|nr:PQQ-dependent sugar dehydrogenase [Sphingomonas sp. BT-65]MCW4463734.1 PQQ-dependent sugar dehydrogenase [Sphingomonas sp. BT-65]